MHNHYIVSTYRVQEVKIVCNNNNCLRHTSPLVDILTKEVYCPDIETRIYLIQYDNLGIEELYLEHLDTTFLTTRESYIQIALKEALIESYGWEELLHHTTEYKRCWGLVAWMETGKIRSIDCFEVFKESNPRDLWNVLK